MIKSPKNFFFLCFLFFFVFLSYSFNVFTEKKLQTENDKNKENLFLKNKKETFANWLENNYGSQKASLEELILSEKVFSIEKVVDIDAETVDLREYPNLTKVVLNGVYLDKTIEIINLSNNTKLKQLVLRLNDLTTIDLSNNLVLEELDLSFNNNLQELDLSKNKLLKRLNLADTKNLKLLNLEDVKSLTYLNLNLANSLRELDLSYNKELMFVSFKLIKSLKVIFLNKEQQDNILVLLYDNEKGSGVNFSYKE